METKTELYDPSYLYDDTEVVEEAKEMVSQQTMIRVKDAKASLDFYTKVLGMNLIFCDDMTKWGFSVYFVAYCKKEVQILKSEENTIVDVATSQTADIEKYLDTETSVLNDCINKQFLRQKAEYSRLNEQVVDCKNIRDELDANRMECVGKLLNVQRVLGIQTDPNEAFLQPLASTVRSSKQANY